MSKSIIFLFLLVFEIQDIIVRYIKKYEDVYIRGRVVSLISLSFIFYLKVKGAISILKHQIAKKKALKYFLKSKFNFYGVVD